MSNFYVTQNKNSNEPDILSKHVYIHVKCTNDRTQTMIVSDDLISDPAVQPLPQPQAQALLDNWIQIENQNPPLDDQGLPILQTRIPMDSFLVVGKNGTTIVPDPNGKPDISATPVNPVNPVKP